MEKVKVGLRLIILLVIMGVGNGQLLFAQQVSGTVTNGKSRETLAGVNILVKGTSTGASTESDGTFEFSVPSVQDTLVVTYIGYHRKEVSISGRTELNIQLVPQAITGEEMVVVGYGEQSQRNVTSSISSVSSEELENSPANQQVGQALQGKIPGVQITKNSGTPGASLMMRIRGSGSVNNSDPLYVIDGNPSADPNDLAPSQIKSVEVLKSASAAAIYGSRGANGVVLITTKEGRPGEPTLNIKYSQGIQRLDKEIDVANAQQYAELYNKALINAGEEPKFDNPESLGEGTNWQNEIYRPASKKNITLSVSGGNETSTYYISGDYFQQEGIMIGTKFNRLNFRVNSNHKINSIIELGEKLQGSYAIKNNISEFAEIRGISNQTLQMDPTVPVKNEDGSFAAPKYSNTFNPVAQVFYTHNKHNRPALSGNVYVNISPLENLKYKSQMNIDYGLSKFYGFDPVYQIFSEQQNRVTGVSRDFDEWTNWSWQNTFSYEQNFGSHSLEILGGVTAQENSSEYVLASGKNIPISANTNSNLRYLDLTTSGRDVSGSAGSFGMLSFLGRINYNFKGTYLATINIRRDGSSKFGRNNRFGTFPSFSLGWRISNEGFMENIGFINDLKVRGGWGALGNQNSLSNYAFASTLTPDLNYPFGNIVSSGQAPIGEGNPDLKWERVEETNFGLDFSGFDNKLTFTADYYYKKTSEMLLRVPVQAYTGVEVPAFQNGGNVLNKGVEFSIGYQNSTQNDLSYNLSANISHNTNEVTKLSNQGATIFAGNLFSIGNVSRTKVGEPIAHFIGYKTEGIFQTKQEVENHAFQTSGTAPGDFKFKDLDGNGVINKDDRAKIGSPWPSLTYGFNASLSWKNFDLNMSLQGVYGSEIWAAWKREIMAPNSFNYHTQSLDSWDGQGSSSSLPRLIASDPNGNFRESDWYIEDGSYLKLRQLQIGYTLPTNLLNRFKISKLRLYISGQNLFTITGYSGYDPEIGTPGNPLDIGIDRSTYPKPRVLTVGLDLGL